MDIMYMNFSYFAYTVLQYFAWIIHAVGNVWNHSSASSQTSHYYLQHNINIQLDCAVIVIVQLIVQLYIKLLKNEQTLAVIQSLVSCLVAFCPLSTLAASYMKLNLSKQTVCKSVNSFVEEKNICHCLLISSGKGYRKTLGVISAIQTHQNKYTYI